MKPLLVVGSYISPYVRKVLACQQREVLKALGAPVSAETYGTTAPRRGVMPI